MNGITININKEISKERIADLLCDAFVGGSNYWYFIKGKTKPPALEFHFSETRSFWIYDYPLNKGGELIIVDREGTDKSEYKLNLVTIEKGLKIMQEKYATHFYDFLQEEDDAITGDVFLQCCLFGEVVYG